MYIYICIYIYLWLSQLFQNDFSQFCAKAWALGDWEGAGTWIASACPRFSDLFMIPFCLLIFYSALKGKWFSRSFCWMGPFSSQSRFLAIGLLSEPSTLLLDVLQCWFWSTVLLVTIGLALQAVSCMDISKLLVLYWKHHFLLGIMVWSAS